MTKASPIIILYSVPTQVSCVSLTLVFSSPWSPPSTPMYIDLYGDWVTNIFTYIKWGWSSLKVQVNYHKLVAQNPMVPAPIALHSLPLVILTVSWEFPTTSYWRRQTRGIKLLNHWYICMVCHSSWNWTAAALPLRWPWSTVEKKKSSERAGFGVCALYSLLHM